MNQPISKIDTVIFDLGNVLVDWSPSYLFDKLFHKKEERDYFLKNICTPEWHNVQDGGKNPTEATEEKVKEHPEWEHAIRAFYARWKEMFMGTIDGSVAILQELKSKGYKLYALTNWNAELFNQTIDDFPFLQLFDGKVVSGAVKKTKPGEDIYRHLLDKYHIDPVQALFIDDKEENIQTAEKLGIKGIQFKDPIQLRNELQALGIL
ncbi:MAG TPA: HAD family phosphatase [Flavisolibacter sp.]|nr:HAD family phosphatase [Flavisolibacter sp.]